MCIATGAAALSMLAGAVAPVAAWPTQPVRLVVPFAAGGTTDVMGRIIAERLGALLPATVIVENLGGAGGNTGAALVAKSPADGHVLLVATPGPAIMNQFMYSRMPYETATAFAPVAFIATIPSVLAASPKIEVRTLAELVSAAKAKPDAFNYGSAGNGSTGHLGGALLNAVAGIAAKHVPYRGSAPMLQDVLSGNIQYTIDTLPGLIGQIQAGSARGLAVTSAKRSAQLPELPTSAEAGFPELKVGSFLCLLAPAGTPQALLDRVSGLVAAMLAEPETRDRLIALGAELDPLLRTPADLARYLAAETPGWKRMVETAGARIE